MAFEGTDGTHGEPSSGMSSFFDKNSESNPTTEDNKKQSWKDVLALVQK